MPRNDDGEFELILGNRQLMSVFFIVVILLGVFFAMGYIVGRNSSPVGAPEVASHQSGDETGCGGRIFVHEARTAATAAAPRQTCLRKPLRSPRKPPRSKVPRPSPRRRPSLLPRR